MGTKTLSLGEGGVCWKSPGEEIKSCVMASVLSTEYEAAQCADVVNEEVGVLSTNARWHDYCRK